MARDELDERVNIELSRAQRQAWERSLLLIAGISPTEASRIAHLAAQDRAAVEEMRHAA
ncbi:hypothetical protein LB553_00895 [Mesorhizobium sp. CA8]|uniref:hypothetical protein n=1 Tax=Mesorhizobium sp. CA8 TaxID=2876637 RepID=UPI001CCCE23A|nr:hypothetical protein [Mesorhizobium sp. CA8]MBZ9759444.1 hypothetical protein [Mesorhizobium sp. CA8]